MIPDGYSDFSNHAANARSFHEYGESFLLSSSEQLSVIRAIFNSSGIRTLADYSAWLSWDLDSLLHHRAWACGLGCLHPDGYKAKYWFASRSLNEQCSLDQSVTRTVVSPLLSGWLHVRRPQIYSRAMSHDAGSGGEDIFGTGRLANAVLHCQMDPDNKWTSVFCFANMDERPSFRERLLLDVLIPHLHATLCRVIIEESSAQLRSETPPIKLTGKELLILRHIRLGRTRAEIANAPHKRVFTVNNQVVKLLARLGARNRTQAVVMAKEMGLFKT